MAPATVSTVTKCTLSTAPRNCISPESCSAWPQSTLQLPDFSTWFPDHCALAFPFKTSGTKPCASILGMQVKGLLSASHHNRCVTILLYPKVLGYVLIKQILKLPLKDSSESKRWPKTRGYKAGPGQALRHYTWKKCNEQCALPDASETSVSYKVNPTEF